MIRQTPSILKQTKFKSGFFYFGSQMAAATRRLFNPALISIDGKDWLITRWSEDKKEGGPWGYNSLWAFELDSGDHRPIRGIKIPLAGYKHQHFEDPRIIRRSDGKLWLSYCTFCLQLKPGDDGGLVPDARDKMFQGAHQGVALLDSNWRVISQMDPIHGKNGSTVLMNTGHEKNWIWFEHTGIMHCVYMTEPHEVFRLGADMQSAQTWLTEANSDYSKKWGQPRGGTPPVKIRDEYWSFFHSSTPWRNGKRQYHMGAYAFKARPPFNITRMVARPILSGSDEDPWMHYHPKVVFPGGAIYRKETWFVAMGINDMACAWIEIPHAKLAKICNSKTKGGRKATNRVQPILTGLEEGLYFGGLGSESVAGPEVPGVNGHPERGVPGKVRRPRPRRIRRRRGPGLWNNQGVSALPVQDT